MENTIKKIRMVYIMLKVVKSQELLDYFAKNPLYEEHKLLMTYFPNRELALMTGNISEKYDGWILVFDRVKNFKRVGFSSILVLKTS